MKEQNPLQVLFAGDTVAVRFLNGQKQSVHVRALPLRHLHHVIATYEHKHLFVELCTYTAAGRGKAPDGQFSEIPAPQKLWPVPAGWADNLDDASIEALYQKAEALNFQRAVTWARGQIAAKKNIAPILQQSTAQVMPMVQQLIQPVLEKLEQLSASAPSVASSSASPASKS